MSVPSSTSSSERRLLVRALATCALVLLASRLALAFWSPEWVGRAEARSAARWLRGAEAERLEVLALGSSRMQTAFDPAVFADLSGLEPDAVANTAFVGATFFDQLAFLRDVGTLPASTRLVLVEVPRWNFNVNRLNPVNGKPAFPSPQVRIDGSLADRWAVDQPLERVTLVGEWVWPFYLRQPLWNWVRRLAQPEHLPPGLPAETGHWDPERNQQAGKQPRLRAKNIIRYHFHEARMSHFAERNLELLIAKLRASGARVALVRIPTRKRYLLEARSDPATAALLDEADRFVDSLAAEDVVLAECIMPAECGVSSQSFTDYGHMDRNAARAFTRWLVHRIGDATRD